MRAALSQREAELAMHRDQLTAAVRRHADAEHQAEEARALLGQREGALEQVREVQGKLL